MVCAKGYAQKKQPIRSFRCGGEADARATEWFEMFLPAENGRAYGFVVDNKNRAFR